MASRGKGKSGHVDKDPTRLEDLKRQIANIEQQFQTYQQTAGQLPQVETLPLYSDHQELLYRISKVEHQLSGEDRRAKHLEHGLWKLEGQVATLRESLLHLTAGRSPQSAPEANFPNQLAENVTSVVGLSEAITEKYSWLRWTWRVIFCAGLVATIWFTYATTVEYLDDPSATKIKIVSHDIYEYPSVIFCPNAWLDLDKAFRLGFSVEALKYAFGYINSNGDKIGPKDSVTARKEFLSSYNRSKFSSFNEFLMAISADVPVEHSVETYVESNVTSALCARCDQKNLEKLAINGAVCYNFKLKPEDGRITRTGISRPIGVKMEDRSAELIGSPLWRVLIGTNAALKKPTVPAIVLRPFKFAWIRFSPQHLLSLNTDGSPCAPAEKVPENYSSEICMQNCYVPLYKPVLNCTPFDRTVEPSGMLHPSEMCNTFDSPNAYSWMIFLENTANQKDKGLGSKEVETCRKACPMECERMTYETIKQEEMDAIEYTVAVESIMEKHKNLNMTLAIVYLENAALSQGGILTMTELSTITFTTLVSNVGGTLGLFVGATTLTLCQIVLFLVKYWMERRRKAQIRPTQVMWKPDGKK